MKSKNDRVRQILEHLPKAYPNVRTQLNHQNPFELLIATILSAQCTDKQVNAVTPELFRRYPTPESLQAASLKSIETLIHATGFFHNKARHIKNCAQALVTTYNGQVPQTLEALVSLPGVGRKTANVVLGAAFGKPGMVVDTHVARISKRLGFTDHKDAVKIEFDLMKIIPKEKWNHFSLHLIYLGRSLCLARKPKCPECFLRDLCPFDLESVKTS